MRICKKCNEEKELKYFWKRKCYKDGYSPSCKDCSCNERESKERWRVLNPSASTIWARNNKSKVKLASLKSRLKRLYNLSIDEYYTLLKMQSYKCAICKQPQNDNKILCVDHCHITNKVRGLLCDRCNKSIGMMEDSIELLQSAIIYLT